MPDVFFFSFLLVADPKTFYLLNREDNWTENLTAVWFLLSGFLLFAAALMERSFFRRCVYVLGGMAMVFVTGEEISWGQRIFGFATPDFLMLMNQQKEFNVHNINNQMFSRIYLNGTLILCMVTSAAFFFRKDRVFGIPLPSIPLMLGFLIIISHHSGTNVGGFLDYIAFGKIMLLLLFSIVTLLSGQVKLFIAPAATSALVLALSYMNYHRVYPISVVALGRHSLNEVCEYLFGIGCLFYCLELALAQGRFAAIPRAPFTALKLPGRRIPFSLMTYSLVIAGSIGLIFF